jgi:hypothetical protein
MQLYLYRGIAANLCAMAMGRAVKVVNLHGISHGDVTGIIIKACTECEVPFIVITGKSTRMKRIVSFAVKKFNLEIKDTIENTGRVVIDENR